jgi:competence protein ComEC
LRRDRVATVSGIALATGYSLLAGFSVPTQRTLLMLGSFLLLRECARVVRPSTSLGLAALGVVVLDPFCTLSAGFWLSFLAVAAIVGYAGGRVLRESSLRAAVTVQAAVFVALLPVTLAIFGSVSLAGLLVNVVAIPLFTFVLVPLALGATALLLVLPDPLGGLVAGALLRLGELAAAAVAPLLSRAADHPQALWFASPPPWWYLLAGVAVLCVLPPWPLRLRVTGALALLPLLGAADRPSAHELRATVLDVGHASAVLVQTAGHALLYGTGESFRSDGAITERAVIPAVAARGLRRLDAVLLPRLDRDSGAGVTALLARLPVASLYAEPGRSGELPPEFTACRQGGGWDWEGWQFDLLDAPDAGCALRVRGPGGTLLLADRLDADAGQQLLSRGLARVDVLLVPRQGSLGASPPAFLAALGAKLAIASLRESARSSEAYGTLAARYADAHIALVDTATQGALTLRLAPGRAPQLSGSRTGRPGVWSLEPAAVR